MKQLTLITPDKIPVEITVVDELTKNQLLRQTKAGPDNSLRKKFTARTYVLPGGKILIEFFDRQTAIINSLDDYKKLDRIWFVKNIIYSLRVTFHTWLS